jgi:transaldolase
VGTANTLSDPAFHLYVDSADIDQLRAILPHPLVYGVTTNPTLLRRAGLSRDALPKFLERTLALKARAVHLQVQSTRQEGILEDARATVELAPKGFVIPKIPATRAGFAAGGQLTADGMRVTYTAVFEPEQALFAAIGGAAYAAPYLGRMPGDITDAFGTIARMQAIVSRYGPGTRLLVASVRSREDFLTLLDIGVGAITVPPSLVPELLDHAATIEAEQAFLADAEFTE